MAMPLVSIITPCYNGEAYLDRYFQSILHQTYPNLELIFINDGSTDGTDAVMEQYRPLLEEKGVNVTYLLQENVGQAAALNRGLKLFQGEYLTWPDADDEMTPDCIEKKVAYLEAHPGCGLVRSDGVYYNEATGERKSIAAEKDKGEQDIFESLLLVHTYGCCGCYMMRKELLLQCYPDRDIFTSRVGQNWQLLVPAASLGKCGYIDEALYTVYEHGDSHSRKERSAQEFYQRWDGFTEVLLRAIDISCCDREAYREMVLENNARQQFYYAIAAGDKAAMKWNFDQMKQYGHASFKERLLFLKHGFK